MPTSKSRESNQNSQKKKNRRNRELRCRSVTMTNGRNAFFGEPALPREEEFSFELISSSIHYIRPIVFVQRLEVYQAMQCSEWHVPLRHPLSKHVPLQKKSQQPYHNPDQNAYISFRTEKPIPQDASNDERPLH